MQKQKINMTVGRFQPFTLGHLNMIKSGDAHCIVYMIEDKPMETKKNGVKLGSKSYTKDTIKKIIDYIQSPIGDLDEKENELLKRPFSNELIEKELEIVKRNNKDIIDIVIVSNVFDALDKFNKFITDNKDKYEPQYWMCGDDRVEDYSKMIGRYDELETYKGSGENIPNLLKDILKTSIGDGRSHAVSGTMVRKALLNKDKEAFSKIMPNGIDIMFDDFVKALEDFKEKLKTIINETKMKSLKEYIYEKSN